MRPDVAAVLFDEPLTVIDPHLKWLLRRKLKQIHQQLKLSLLYVTHDQTEALTFADQRRGDEPGRDRAESARRAAVRDAGASLRRPLHRLARHELPRLRVERRVQRRSPAIARRDEQHAGAAGRRAIAIGVRPEYLELAPSPGRTSRAGARRRGSRPGHPDDGATGSRRGTRVWAKLRDPERCPRSGTAFAAPAACTLRALRRRSGECHELARSPSISARGGSCCRC